MPAGDPRGRTVPAGVTAELARAAGLPLPELVGRATELARAAHPAAAAVWQLAAQACAGDSGSADIALRARIDGGLGAALTISDNTQARVMLARAVTAREELGDPVALALARGRAALAAAVGGDEAAVAVLHDIAPVIDTHGTAEDRVVHLRRRAWATLLTAGTEDDRSLGVTLLYHAEAAASAIASQSEVLACQAMLLELAPPLDAGERIEAWQRHVDQLHELQWWWRLGAASLRLGQERVVAGIDPEDADEVLSVLADAIRYALEWGEPEVAAHATYLRARLLVDVQRAGEARIAAFFAVMRATQIGDDQLAARARLELGAAYGALGEVGPATEILETAVAATDPSDVETLVRAGQLMGSTALVDGDAAAAVWDSALWVRRLQADALVTAGLLDDAISILDEPLVDADPSWARAELEDHAARLLANASRGEQALARAARAEALYEADGDHGGAALAAALTAQITLRLLADAAAAEEQALRAVHLAAQCDDEEVAVEAASTLAMVQEALATPRGQ